MTTEDTSSTVDKSNWEWVEVPATDMFDEPHSGARINREFYGPGRHFLAPEFASELRRILKVKEQADIRLIQPRKDAKTMRLTNVS